jgi:hypothetical protein
MQGRTIAEVQAECEAKGLKVPGMGAPPPGRSWVETDEQTAEQLRIFDAQQQGLLRR